MMRNISNGETTLDVFKRNRLRRTNLFASNVHSRLSPSPVVASPLPPYVWIPRALFSDSEIGSLPETFHGAAIPVQPGEKLYDLGKENNWARWRALARNECALEEPRSRNNQ